MVVANGGEVEGRMELEIRVSRCELLYTEWINNKVLLYSIVDYILYPVINHNGKEYEKEHTCVTESLCCTSETNTT